jgi:hypothetical protein
LRGVLYPFLAKRPPDLQQKFPRPAVFSNSAYPMLGELQKGVSKLADSDQRSKLLHWLKYDLAERFEGGVPGLDLDTAGAWGEAQQLGETLQVDRFTES